MICLHMSYTYDCYELLFAEQMRSRTELNERDKHYDFRMYEHEYIEQTHNKHKF